MMSLRTLISTNTWSARIEELTLSVIQRFDDGLADFYFSHWWQIYLGMFLTGLISSGYVATQLMAVQKGYSSLLRVLLYSSALNVWLPVGFSVAGRHDSVWVLICFFQMRCLETLAAGAMLTGMICTAIARRSVEPDMFQWSWKLRWATQIAIASLFVTAGLQKFIAKESLDFFHASGYGGTFFLTIATWECFWGIALLLRPSMKVSVVMLSGEMCGAVYTHFHNYFTRGFPGPAANSLDALRALLLLASLQFATSRMKKERISDPVEPYLGPR
jgi:uncharacterized membrane protein YphA (DoxX/SURF4 family)